MHKPVIGITVECRHDPDDLRTAGNLTLNWNYAQAVAEAGGVPLVVPPMADMGIVSQLIDGWLIPGGDDIDATQFGESNHPLSELQDPARYEGEKALYAAVPDDLPVLGICYGCQFLNVVRGGTLMQHLPDVPNTVPHTGGVMQEYDVEPGTRLAEIVTGPITSGRSYHHQAVGKTAVGLTISARSADGVIEALEATDRPWMVAVQWHPERSLDDAKSRALFEKFIESAREFSAKKLSR